MRWSAKRPLASEASPLVEASGRDRALQLHACRSTARIAAAATSTRFARATRLFRPRLRVDTFSRRPAEDVAQAALLGAAYGRGAHGLRLRRGSVERAWQRAAAARARRTRLERGARRRHREADARAAADPRAKPALALRRRAPTLERSPARGHFGPCIRCQLDRRRAPRPLTLLGEQGAAVTTRNRSPTRRPHRRDDAGASMAAPWRALAARGIADMAELETRR